MPVHHDEDFPIAFAILLAGMLVPALVVFAGRGLLELYVGSRQFVVIAAVAFGLLAWILIERLDIDRTSFGLVAVAWPWPVLFAVLFSFLLLHRDQQIPRGPVAEVFRFLIGDVEGFFLYGALFALAGLGAVGLSRAVEARADHDDRVPEGRVLAHGLGLAVVAVVVLAVGANLATANAASVTAIEPGVDTYDRPTLEVTLDGMPAELRLTAVAPDGTSVTKRLTRAELREAPLRVALRVVHDETTPRGTLPAMAGPYRMRVSALSGVIVDTATFTASSAPEVAVTAPETDTGELTWTDPPDRVVGTDRDEVKVGIAVENGGSFHARVSVSLETPDGDRRSAYRDVTIGPGERVGLVFSLPKPTVEAIQSDHGGTVILDVHWDDRFDDRITVVEVQLPAV